MLLLLIGDVRSSPWPWHVLKVSMKVLGRALDREAYILGLASCNEGQVVGFWNLSLLTVLLVMMTMMMMMMMVMMMMMMVLLMLLTRTVWKSLAFTLTMELMSLAFVMKEKCLAFTLDSGTCPRQHPCYWWWRRWWWWCLCCLHLQYGSPWPWPWPVSKCFFLRRLISDVMEYYE